MANVENDKIIILKRGFEASNRNLTDFSKSLRVVAESLRIISECLQRTDNALTWHTAIGENAEVPDVQIYDWVLVKIRDVIDGAISSVPHIAMFHNSKWWGLEWDGYYGSDEIPFEVIAWRPIEKKGI